MAPIGLCPEMLGRIIKRLNTRHGPGPLPPFVGSLATGAGGEGRITDKEVAGLSASFSVDQASGPDGIPSLALEVASAKTSKLLRSVKPKCLY